MQLIVFLPCFTSFVCFPAHQVLSEKGSDLKGKNLLPRGSKFFPFSADSFLNFPLNQSSFPLKMYISILNDTPRSEGWGGGGGGGGCCCCCCCGGGGGGVCVCVCVYVRTGCGVGMTLLFLHMVQTRSYLCYHEFEEKKDRKKSKGNRNRQNKLALNI